VRLQLIAAMCLLGGAAAAEPGGEATLRVYSDDDDITVVSPSVRVEATAGATTLEIDATADAVTGASVDVVTSASPRPIDERRVELGVGGARAIIAGLAATAVVRGSHERDHDAVRAGAGLRVELMERRLTIDARYLGGYDAIGTVVDADFARDRTLHQLVLGATIVLDPRTLVDVVAEGTSSVGYHASPYRRVPLVDPAMPTPTWLDEAVPETRRWLAATIRWRRAIGESWFASAGYRAYADRWSIASHTATVELRRAIGARVLAGATARGYLQDGAWFYRPSYVDDGSMPQFRTRDRTLGPMRTLFTSLAADVRLDEDDRWHAIAAAGVLASWFPEFPLQADRHAVVLTLSLSMQLEGGLE
jgi:hypothetical protein